MRNLSRKLTEVLVDHIKVYFDRPVLYGFNKQPERFIYASDSASSSPIMYTIVVAGFLSIE